MGYEVFKKLCDESGVSPTKVARETKIDPSALTNWKKGIYQPKDDKRRKLAEFFGVTLEYLDTRDESLRNMEREVQVADEDLKELYLLAKKATPEQKEIAIKFFHALIGD